MLTRQILFKGANAIEQIHLILSTCGYPGDDYVLALSSHADISFCMQDQYRSLPRRPATELLQSPGPNPPQPSVHACQLLEMLLLYRTSILIAMISRGSSVQRTDQVLQNYWSCPSLHRG